MGCGASKKKLDHVSDPKGNKEAGPNKPPSLKKAFEEIQHPLQDKKEEGKDDKGIQKTETVQPTPPDASPKSSPDLPSPTLKNTSEQKKDQTIVENKDNRLRELPPINGTNSNDPEDSLPNIVMKEIQPKKQLKPISARKTSILDEKLPAIA